MISYSIDLRSRVLEACDAGEPTMKVALRFQVSPSWVRRVKQIRREEGRTTPLPPRNGRTCKLAPYYDAIREVYAATPDHTLAELRRKLELVVSLATLWMAVDDLGLTFKKTRLAKLTGGNFGGAVE